ncbi:MAG: hypothetical protein IJR77_06595 [Bacteroidales bacterium]|nr:hypothetical protein [Bacteroidales bacterium]
MTGKRSVLYSEYIIDGCPMVLTPGRMLDGCMIEPPVLPDGEFDPVVDETVDPAPSSFVYDSGKIGAYLEAVRPLIGNRLAPIIFAGPHTAGKVAAALVDAIWRTGHFRLADLFLRAEWKWDSEPIGNMAAFYSSVESAATYIDALGLKLKCYSVRRGPCSVVFKAGTVAEEDIPAEEEDSILSGAPFKTLNPRLGKKRKCPATASDDPSRWIIYIPFDPCDFRLGGSAVSEVTGARSAVAPDVSDTEYFTDCYEVVRELVEDGVVKAGTTVFEGGLMAALDSMCGGIRDIEIDLSGLRNAYGGEKPVRILFAEIPGVLLEIDDIDYDYVDAELLLQDVAYFPLGHPKPGKGDISVRMDEKPGISGILESLLIHESSEGED